MEVNFYQITLYYFAKKIQQKYIKTYKKFQFFLKLNNFGIIILKFIAESLSIEVIYDKNKLIDSFVKKFDDMD